MKAVVLAAGEGSRMRPLTYTRPKVMLTIANKPILEHLLIEARSAGIEEFILIVGYHDEQIRNYFGNGEKWGVNIEKWNLAWYFHDKVIEKELEIPEEIKNRFKNLIIKC